MNIPTTIPITITPEARTQVSALGIDDPLQRMLDHTLQSISDLQRVKVYLEPPYDTGDEDVVVIQAFKEPGKYVVGDSTWERWGRWMTQAFSPDVCRHFSFLLSVGTVNGG